MIGTVRKFKRQGHQFRPKKERRPELFHDCLAGFTIRIKYKQTILSGAAVVLGNGPEARSGDDGRSACQRFFAQEYSRWPDTKIQVFDSSGIICDSKPGLLEETLTTQNGLDKPWLEVPDLRITVCGEPPSWVWRKIAIYSIELNKVTFRSMTLSNDYENAYLKIAFAGGWKFDRGMMDADVVLSKIHFEVLRKAIAENSSDP